MGWVPVVHWRVHPSARRHPGGRQDTQDDRPSRRGRSAASCRGVDGNDVGHAEVVEEQCVDSQEQVDHPATEQEKVSAAGGAGQRKAADPEQQVHEVVLHRDVEQPHRTAAGLAQLCDALATRPITPWGITSAPHASNSAAGTAGRILLMSWASRKRRPDRRGSTGHRRTAGR